MAMISINQHDWSAVEDWFNRKAEEAGYTGWRKYQFSISVSMPSSITKEIDDAVKEMGQRFGESLIKILSESSKDS